jgi:hypothetical protein
MIQVGDKVRYKNSYLKAFGPHSRKYRRMRGKQEIMTVVEIQKGQYDWKNKKYSGDIVRLNQNNLFGFSWINTFWLSFVRRDT